jgi:hypothetical protein
MDSWTGRKIRVLELVAGARFDGPRESEDRGSAPREGRAFPPRDLSHWAAGMKTKKAVLTEVNTAMP